MGAQNIATAIVQSDKAHRYLQRLCEHFARKVPAEWDTSHGWINFPMGTCGLAVRDHTLSIRVMAEGKSDLARLQEIVGSHLERHAFPEEPKFVWSIEVKPEKRRQHLSGTTLEKQRMEIDK